MCTHCKRIRTDESTWQHIEVYVQKHTHADFSHGICPTCMQVHDGELLRPRDRLS